MLIKSHHYLFFYSIFVLVITHIFELPLFIKSFLGATVFFIVPYLVGMYLVSTITKIFKYDLVYKAPFNYIFYWAIGNIAILILACLLLTLDIFNIYILIALIIASFTLCIFKVGNQKYINSNDKFPLIITILIGLVSVIFMKIYSPFPFIANWDLFPTEFIVDRIVNRNEFYIFSESYSPLTFNAKYDIRSYNLLFAIASVWSSSKPLYISWFGSFIHVPIYLIGVYLFSYHFSRDKAISVISVFIAAWISIHNAPPAGMQNFISGIIIASFFPYFMVFADKYVCEEKLNNRALIFFITMLLFVITFHYIISIMVLAVPILYVLVLKMRYNKVIKWIVSVLTITLFTTLLIQYKYNIINTSYNFIDFMQTSESGSINYSFINKLDKLVEWYPPIIIYVAILGMAILVIPLFKKSRPFNLEKISCLCITTISILLIYISPITYIHRIIILIHPFISFFAAFIIMKIMRIISNRGKYVISTNVVLIIVILTILLLQAPFTLITTQSTSGDANNVATSFMYYDIEMGEWLKENVPENTIIISEKEQQNILMGLSGLDSIGGAYSSTKHEILIKSIFTTPDAKVAHNLVSQIIENDTPVIIIMSGRVSKSIKENRSQPVYFPVDFKHFNGFNKFNNSQYFNMIHNIDNQIYAYEVVN